MREFGIENLSKEARSILKCLLYNYEKNGGNKQKAIDVEIVKQKCTQIADYHRTKLLLSKGMCGLIKACI